MSLYNVLHTFSRPNFVKGQMTRVFFDHHHFEPVIQNPLINQEIFQFLFTYLHFPITSAVNSAPLAKLEF